MLGEGHNQPETTHNGHECGDDSTLTLREIAARRPATLAELGEISGLGTKKLEAYGEDVLAVVAAG